MIVITLLSCFGAKSHTCILSQGSLYIVFFNYGVGFCQLQKFYEHFFKTINTKNLQSPLEIKKGIIHLVGKYRGDINYPSNCCSKPDYFAGASLKLWIC